MVMPPVLSPPPHLVPSSTGANSISKSYGVAPRTRHAALSLQVASLTSSCSCVMPSSSASEHVTSMLRRVAFTPRHFIPKPTIEHLAKIISCYVGSAMKPFNCLPSVSLIVHSILLLSSLLAHISISIPFGWCFWVLFGLCSCPFLVLVWRMFFLSYFWSVHSLNWSASRSLVMTDSSSMRLLTPVLTFTVILNNCFLTVSSRLWSWC